MVQQTTVVILQKLEQLLAMEGTLQSTSDKSQFRDLQALLCATLQVHKYYLFTYIYFYFFEINCLFRFIF